MTRSKKILIWLLVSISLAILAISLILTIDLFLQPGSSRMEALLESYISQNETLAVFIFTGLATLSSMMPPMSTITFLPPVLMVWNKWFIISLIMIGWMIGGALSYALTRFIARPVLEKFFSFEKVDYFAAKLPPRLKFWFVVLFRLATPIEIPSYVLGFIKYPFFLYLLATFLGEIHNAILYTFGAGQFLEKNIFASAIWFGVGFILLLIFIYIFIIKFKRLTGNDLDKKFSIIDFEFLRIAWKNYRQTGALFPTSKYVAKRVADLVIGKNIVEYGSGSGVITKTLLQNLPEDSRLLCVELQEEFIDTLNNIKDKRVNVICDDALNISLRLTNYLPKVETIITSLPLSLMKNEKVNKIIKNSYEALAKGGVLIMTQDNPFLARFLKPYFKSIKFYLEIRNLPPRFIIVGQKN